MYSWYKEQKDKYAYEQRTLAKVSINNIYSNNISQQSQSLTLNRDQPRPRGHGWAWFDVTISRTFGFS